MLDVIVIEFYHLQILLVHFELLLFLQEHLESHYNLDDLESQLSNTQHSTFGMSESLKDDEIDYTIHFFIFTITHFFSHGTIRTCFSENDNTGLGNGIFYKFRHFFVLIKF